jgi:alpha-N-acetylglucosaminidase
LFFKMLDQSFKTGNTPDLKAFDKEVKDWEWKWVNQHNNAYSANIKGNSFEVATKLYAKYNDRIKQAYAK